MRSNIQFLSAVPALQAAASDSDNAPGLRRFSMCAYTGGPMLVGGWEYPIVVDLAGLRVSAKPRPILKDHNPSLIVGHTEGIDKSDGQLRVTGTISGAGHVAQEVVAAADNGFPWQASIGATVQKAMFVPEGKTARANGREVPGPAYIARAATLGEISFVALGADDDTTAQMLAAQHQHHKPNTPEIASMEFDTWLQAQGFVLADLSDAQQQSLRALFDAQQAPPAAPADDDHEKDGPDPDQLVASMRNEAAAECERLAAIHRLCAEHPRLEAQAIREGWDATRCELEVLRASRPQAPAVHAGGDDGCTSATLQAACILSAKLPSPERHVDEQALDAASKRFRGGIGLQELILEAAWANGYSGRNFRDSRAVLRAAFAPVQAGWSGIDLGGILSNVANKFLLDGFTSVESAWRAITALRSVSDFKTVTSYRLVGANQYERIAPGGEIKHGQLGEQAYQNQADTHGLMLSIDRRDIINDDLGAITAVPRMLGRGSGLKINDVFWSTFLNHASFFHADNANVISGATSALGIDGLTKTEVAFMKQTDPDGKPLGTMPAILLVPPALTAMASQLQKSTELRDNGSAAKYPVSNPHQGKFRSVVSRYLSNPSYTGHSDTAWYLLAEPADLPVIECAFLNGQEAPVIETAEADFNVLGIQMRGYHDFGCALQEPRGGIKATGA